MPNDKLPGEFEPTRAPIATTLTPPDENETEQSAPPMSPRVAKIMAQQPSRSYAQRVIAQQPVSSLRMADRMKLQSPETGK